MKSTYRVKVGVGVELGAVRLFRALPYRLHERVQREISRDVDCHDVTAKGQKECDNEQLHRVD